MDACHVVSKYPSEWLESQFMFSKQSLNKYFLPLRALVASNSQDISAAPLIGDDKVGVLLLNLGGPETLDDVQPFLFNLFADPPLVPLGSVDELLAAYDSQRRQLPPPVTMWEWGWTTSAETWNGRAAMLAVLDFLHLANVVAISLLKCRQLAV